MNPNHLLKDELLYELLVRGISSDSDVHTLRKLFRAVVTDKVVCDVRNLTTLSVEELFESTDNKAGEMQNLIKQQEAELFQLSPRFRTRLKHLRGHLRHLGELDPSALIIPRLRYQQARERLDYLENSLPMVDGAARGSPGKEEDEVETTNMTQEEMDDQLNPLAEARTDIGTVSTVMGTLGRESGTASEQMAPRDVGIVAAPVRASEDCMKQVFSPQLYQRFPHALSSVIKELSVVDGTEVNGLYNFLLRLIKVRQVAQMNDSAMYELMFPYCKGELQCLVTQAISNKENFENFHDRLLRHFIPVRETSCLRMARYERVQGEGEHFFCYVQAIRDAALVLCIKQNDAQVVQRIIEGLTPTQHSHFIFQLPPSSFALLEQLAIVERNISYADRLREGQVPGVQIAATESVSEHVETEGSGRRSQDTRLRKVVCFYCRKPGHTQNRCFLRASHKNKGEHKARSSRS